MVEIGVFHNGASSLPVITTKDGVTLNDGTLAEVHQAAQATLVNQVRQGAGSISPSEGADNGKQAV